MSLTLRPHSINLYAYSKLLYICNSIDLRIADINMFTKTAKSFLYADLLEKPSQLTLFREIEQGSLGLLCIQTRASASRPWRSQWIIPGRSSVNLYGIFQSLGGVSGLVVAFYKLWNSVFWTSPKKKFSQQFWFFKKINFVIFRMQPPNLKPHPKIGIFHKDWLKIDQE